MPFYAQGIRQPLTKGKKWQHFKRNRFKSGSWRKDAMNFIRNKFKPKAKAWWNKRMTASKVGWTARAGKYGTKARTAQNKWRKTYFSNHGRVV